MSENPEGSAVVTTDQIYAEVREIKEAFLILRTRFEAVDSLEKRVSALEDNRRNGTITSFSWALSAASVVAAVYGNVKG